MLEGQHGGIGLTATSKLGSHGFIAKSLPEREGEGVSPAEAGAGLYSSLTLLTEPREEASFVPSG